MSLESTYKAFILNKILLQYLYDGNIPTSDELKDDLIEYQKTHLDLSLPRSKYSDFSVTRGGNSSAELLETISEQSSDDIKVVTQEIYNQAILSGNYYDRWIREVRRLNVEVNKLYQRITNLLLLTNNTEGYFGTVYDDFSDLNEVDTASTTCLVNVNEGIVSLNDGSEESGTISQVNTNTMVYSDVSFLILTKKPGTTFYNLGGDNNLLKLFKNDNSSWIGKVTSATTGQMTCEIRANVSPIAKNVSKISIEYTGEISNNSTITAQYSVDGYKWYIVPTNEASKPLNSKISWNFDSVELKWIKFIIYKPSHDIITPTGYEYIYSCRNIKLYENAYHSTRGNLLYTNSLYYLDTNDNISPFSKAEISVCENIPDGTGIKYYLSASTNNLTWTDWHQVVPSDRDNLIYPKIVSFGGAKYKDITELSDTSYKLNSNYDYNQLVTEFNNSNILQYRFKNSEFAAININIPVTEDTDIDSIANSIIVWRNIRNRQLYPNYPDSSLVRNGVRGWGIDGTYYSCYFEVIDKNGKFFNFGPNECILDNKNVSGSVRVSKGIHKFQTLLSNWFDISDNYNRLGYKVSTEEVLKEIDPLYPYNHKLIIEGFPYDTGFVGDQVYIGTDISSEYYCTLTSLFDLENNVDSFNYFATKDLGINSNNLVILIRYNPNRADYINELFYVKWYEKDLSANVYKYIKLQAELSTTNNNITPYLSSYRIRLGN